LKDKNLISETLAKHRGKFSRSWTIRYTTAICLPLHSRDSRWLDDSSRLVIIQVSWFITRDTVMVYARRGGDGINWNKLDEISWTHKTPRAKGKKAIFEACLPIFISVKMEIWGTVARWKSFGVKSRDRFSISNGRCDILVNESWDHRDPPQKSEIPRRCGSQRPPSKVKRRERKEQSETGMGERGMVQRGRGWERMGGKRIKVFRSRKLFMAATFTVFFVAAVNEARFLITLGCSMILL